MKLINILASLVIFGGALYLYGCDSNTLGSGPGDGESVSTELVGHLPPGWECSPIEHLDDVQEGLTRRCCTNEIGQYSCAYRLNGYPIPSPPGGGGGGEPGSGTCEHWNWTGECVGEDGEVASDCWVCSD